MNAVNNINNPMNALLLSAKNKIKSPANGLFACASTQNMAGISNIYDNINNMRSSMDKGEKR